MIIMIVMFCLLGLLGLFYINGCGYCYDINVDNDRINNGIEIGFDLCLMYRTVRKSMQFIILSNLLFVVNGLLIKLIKLCFIKSMFCVLIY